MTAATAFPPPFLFRRSRARRVMLGGSKRTRSFTLVTTGSSPIPHAPPCERNHPRSRSGAGAQINGVKGDEDAKLLAGRGTGTGAKDYAAGAGNQSTTSPHLSVHAHVCSAPGGHWPNGILHRGQYGEGSYPLPSGFQSSPRYERNSAVSACFAKALSRLLSVSSRMIFSAAEAASFSISSILARRSATCSFRIAALPCSVISFSRRTNRSAAIARLFNIASIRFAMRHLLDLNSTPLGD